MLHSIRRVLGIIIPFARGNKGQPTDPAPKLTGAPSRLRLKTYSGAGGSVYQYVYQGQMKVGDSIKFVFKVTRNRQDWNSVEVSLSNEIVRQWEAKEERQLRSSDRYAVAKLTLFEFFDESGEVEPVTMLRPDFADLGRHLVTLGLV